MIETRLYIYYVTEFNFEAIHDECLNDRLVKCDEKINLYCRSAKDIKFKVSGDCPYCTYLLDFQIIFLLSSMNCETL